MTATIVITTRNRRDDLSKALSSCQKQTVTSEILVIDDASDDGTSDMVATMFPFVRLIKNAQPTGYIRARNDAAKLAKGDVIISIDDDAEFSHPDIVKIVLDEIESNAIAAIAIPFIDVNIDGILKQIAPDNSGIWITNEFIGTAHAIRKDVFLKAGGYRDALTHQGEEGDLCIRLLNRGWHVRLGSSPPIFHYYSPLRSIERMNVFGQRNLLLFAWQNVPDLLLIPHILATSVNGLIWGWRKKVFWYRLRGFLRGISTIAKGSVERAPVSIKAYSLYRELKKEGPLCLRTTTDLENKA